MDKYLKINDLYHLSDMGVSDIPLLLEYMNDVDIFNNTLRIPSPYKESDADTFIKVCRQTERQHKQIINWAIRNEENALMGGIGRFMKSENDTRHKDEIGYWLAKPFRGQGIMTEIVKGYADYLFKTTQLIRLEAVVFPHNLASMKVLEKAHFDKEGYCRNFQIKRGVVLDGVMFSRIK